MDSHNHRECEVYQQIYNIGSQIKEKKQIKQQFPST